MVYIFGQRLSREKSNRNSVRISFPHCIRSCMERKHISAEGGGGRKLPAFAPINIICVPRESIGNHLPIHGCFHSDFISSFEVRLVKAGEHTMSVIRLK